MFCDGCFWLLVWWPAISWGRANTGEMWSSRWYRMLRRPSFHEH